MSVFPKISVIIPVYNSEKYLSECIKSILSQTFNNFELIIVNDGSTDKSSNIINYFKNIDSRIIAINKPNSGVSSARNSGIYRASGEYVTFIDSDDYVSNDYLSVLISPISQRDYDIIESGLTDFYDEKFLQNGILPDKCWNLNEELEYINFIKLFYNTSPVAKLYKSSILKGHSIAFNPNINSGEDKEFNLTVFPFLNSAYTLSYSGYFYRKDSGESLSKAYHREYEMFCDQIRQWDILHLGFRQKRFYSNISKSHLANELLNIINDYICKVSLSIPVSQHKSLFQGINLSEHITYIKYNEQLIEDKNVYKFLIRNGKLKIAFVLYKLRNIVINSI